MDPKTAPYGHRFATADDIRTWAYLPPDQRLTAGTVARYRLWGDGRPISSSVLESLPSLPTAEEVEAMLGVALDPARERILKRLADQSSEPRNRPRITPAAVREQVGELRLAAKREVEAWEWMLDEHEPCKHRHDGEALDDVWSLGEPRCLAGWTLALRNALASFPSSFAAADEALAVR